MRPRKFLILPLFFIILLLHTSLATANSARIYSLSLNTNDYWIAPDSMNVFANPAYISLYSNTLEVTAADRSGQTAPLSKVAPFSSFYAKLDDRITLGVALGYPHPSFYNLYSSGNPGDTYKDFTSNVDTTEIPDAGNILTDNCLLFLGYDLDNLKLGISTSYIGLNTQDITEDAPAGTTEVKTTTHRDFSINTGLLKEKAGPFESIAVNFGAEIPYLTRKYAKTTETSSDIREINGTNAWLFKLGFAGNILTAENNDLTIAINYSADNFDCISRKSLDNNNDGDFTGIGEEELYDSFMAQHYSMKYGLADRLMLSNGFAFIGIYSHIFKFKKYARGHNMDGALSEISINKLNRYTVPLILGGEINLTKWLTFRISGTKNIVFYTKWYDETTGKTFTDYTSAEGDAMINAGIGLNFNNFSADLVFDTPWSGNSDPLAGDFNDYTAAKLNLTWRY